LKLRVNVNGKDYEVEVEVLDAGPQPGLADYGLPRPVVSTQSTAPIAAEKASPSPPASAAEGSSADGGNVFRSPISGVVKQVAVAVGQIVKTNDELMVLEAMKMETVLTSHGDGTVAQVLAQVGDSVQVGQSLVEFE
jgi:biotin carboxyl carrier protein